MNSHTLFCHLQFASSFHQVELVQRETHSSNFYSSDSSAMKSNLAASLASCLLLSSALLISKVEGTMDYMQVNPSPAAIPPDVWYAELEAERDRFARDSEVDVEEFEDSPERDEGGDRLLEIIQEAKRHDSEVDVEEFEDRPERDDGGDHLLEIIQEAKRHDSEEESKSSSSEESKHSDGHSDEHAHPDDNHEEHSDEPSDEHLDGHSDEHSKEHGKDSKPGAASKKKKTGGTKSGASTTEKTGGTKSGASKTTEKTGGSESGASTTTGGTESGASTTETTGGTESGTSTTEKEEESHKHRDNQVCKLSGEKCTENEVCCSHYCSYARGFQCYKLAG